MFCLGTILCKVLSSLIWSLYEIQYLREVVKKFTRNNGEYVKVYGLWSDVIKKAGCGNLTTLNFQTLPHPRGWERGSFHWCYWAQFLYITCNILFHVLHRAGTAIKRGLAWKVFGLFQNFFFIKKSWYLLENRNSFAFASRVGEIKPHRKATKRQWHYSNPVYLFGACYEAGCSVEKMDKIKSLNSN